MKTHSARDTYNVVGILKLIQRFILTFCTELYNVLFQIFCLSHQITIRQYLLSNIPVEEIDKDKDSEILFTKYFTPVKTYCLPSTLHQLIFRTPLSKCFCEKKVLRRTTTHLQKIA